MLKDPETIRRESKPFHAAALLLQLYNMEDSQSKPATNFSALSTLSDNYCIREPFIQQKQPMFFYDGQIVCHEI
jgi:hypothetical protein